MDVDIKYENQDPSRWNESS